MPAKRSRPTVSQSMKKVPPTKKPAVPLVVTRTNRRDLPNPPFFTIRRLTTSNRGGAVAAGVRRQRNPQYTRVPQGAKAGQPTKRPATGNRVISATQYGYDRANMQPTGSNPLMPKLGVASSRASGAVAAGIAPPPVRATTRTGTTTTTRYGSGRVPGRSTTRTGSSLGTIQVRPETSTTRKPSKQPSPPKPPKPPTVTVKPTKPAKPTKPTTTVKPTLPVSKFAPKKPTTTKQKTSRKPRNAR